MKNRTKILILALCISMGSLLVSVTNDSGLRWCISFPDHNKLKTQAGSSRVVYRSNVRLETQDL